MGKEIKRLFFAAQFLITFPPISLAFFIPDTFSPSNYRLPASLILADSERQSPLLLDNSLFLTAQAPLYPNPKLMDNFDRTSEAIFAWWDGDGTKVYTRTFDEKQKRSGISSMKVDYIKRSEGLKFSFFAFQPKQDGINNDFSQYDKLVFWLYTESPLELIVKLEDKSTPRKGSFEEKFKLEGKREWQKIEFKFSQAKNINLSQIDNVLFFAQPGQYKVKGTFWLEDIYLIKEASVPQQPPNPPQIKGIELGKRGYELKWSDESSSGASIYEVGISDNSQFNNSVFLWTNKNSLSLEEFGLKELYFKVRAWNQLPEFNGKRSEFSQVFKWTPPANPPPIISHVWSQVASDTDNHYDIGSIVRLAVKETYQAQDIIEAKARITSLSTGYNSGEINLSLSEDKSYWFFHWNTFGLKPASDYRVEFSLKDSAGQVARDNSLVISLSQGPPITISRLFISPDLFNLPLFNGFKITYDSQLQDQGPLGKFWNHSYNSYLKFYGDGSIEAVWGNGDIDLYFPKEGNYENIKVNVWRTLTRIVEGFQIEERTNRKFLFNPQGKLTKIIERNGNTTQLIYDTENRLEKIINPYGQEIQFQYANNLLKKIILPWGRELLYEYDAYQRLTAITDAFGKRTEFFYLLDDRLEAIDEQGKRTYFKYDERGRLKSVENNNEENRVKYEYRDEEAKIIVRDSYGNPTTYIFNAIGLVTYRGDPLGGKTYYSYDSRGNLIELIDQRSNKTKFEYDLRGNLIKIVDALGNETEITYHSKFNLPVSIKDSRGNIFYFEYDEKANPIKIIDSQGNITQFRFNSYGQIIERIDSQGNSLKFNYNSFGQLISIIDALGNETKIDYDKGNISSFTDPIGNITQFLYKFPSNLVSQLIDPLGNKTNYQYDERNNLVKLTDALGNERDYTYDSLNRLTEVIFADLSKINYLYDKKSRLIKKIDQNGNTIEYQYDALDRLTQKLYPNGEKIEYKYDPKGNLIELTDKYGKLSFTYDALNRLTEQKLPDGKTINYTYDTVGNLIRLTYPDGSSLNYEYDSLNRLTKITDEKTDEVYQFFYDSLGRRTKLILPNGVNANYQYDANGQIISLSYTDKAGKILKSYRYLYDKNGNRIQIDSTEGEALFGYDKLNQLISAKLPKLNLEYSYDAVGNRLSLKENGKLINYQTNSLNQITQAGDVKYEYDKNGNLIKKSDSKGITEYQYDFDNRLIKIIHPDKSITEYKYDTLGRRIEKINKGEVTRYIYSGWQIIAETDIEGNISKRYIYGVGIDEPLSLVVSKQVESSKYYYLQDALNNVVGLTDREGKLVESYTYDPFGRLFTQNTQRRTLSLQEGNLTLRVVCITLDIATMMQTWVDSSILSHSQMFS